MRRVSDFFWIQTKQVKKKKQIWSYTSYVPHRQDLRWKPKKIARPAILFLRPKTNLSCITRFTFALHTRLSTEVLMRHGLMWVNWKKSKPTLLEMYTWCILANRPNLFGIVPIFEFKNLKKSGHFDFQEEKFGTGSLKIGLESSTLYCFVQYMYYLRILMLKQYSTWGKSFKN